jgi:hypothetical protein
MEILEISYFGANPEKIIQTFGEASLKNFDKSLLKKPINVKGSTVQ